MEYTHAVDCFLLTLAMILNPMRTHMLGFLSYFVVQQALEEPHTVSLSLLLELV